MTAVILTVHSLIVIALIGVVLLQRSDGGALGLGGGAGGGFMSGRGAANALTRTTSVLAAAFFATSLILAIRAGTGEDAAAVIEELTGQDGDVSQEPLGEPTTDDLIKSLGAGDDAEAAGEGGTVTDEAVLDALGASDAAPAAAPAAIGGADEDAGADAPAPDASSGEALDGGETQSGEGETDPDPDPAP